MEKIDDSKKYAPVTKKQREIVRKILKDFPDSKEMFEYEDYQKNQTVGSASEFIMRAVEDNVVKITGREGYAKYIAMRPNAEKTGTHGLFTDDGIVVNLPEVMKEINRHNGNIWTVIVSLRREDAQRLGFDTGQRWRDMLRTQTTELSKNFKIPMKNLKWYGAFHNESHHPHIHMIVYSNDDFDTGQRWRDMLRTQTAELSRNFKIPMKNLKWYGAFHNESHHPHIHMIVYSNDEKSGFLSKKGVENLRSSFANSIFSQDMYCSFEKQTEYRDRLRSDGKKMIAEIVFVSPEMKRLIFELSDRLSKTKGKKSYGYLPPEIKNIVDEIIVELAKDERIKELYNLWYQQKEDVTRIYTDSIPPRKPLVQNEEFRPLKNAVINEILKMTDSIPTDMEEMYHRIKAENPVVAEELKQKLYGIYRENRQNYCATMVTLKLFQYFGSMFENQTEGIQTSRQTRTDRKLFRKIAEKKQAQGLKQ